MFNTGTRVMVLNSSFSGSTGPKKGSIGYIGDISILNGKGQNVFYYGDVGWYMRHHRIVFVRYGLEKKSRFEIRFFISIFPMISVIEAQSVADGNTSVDEVITKKIDAVEKFNPTGNKYFNELLNMVTNKYGKSHVHMGIITKFPSINNLIESDILNFSAWVECFMHDEIFYDINTSMINKEHHVAGTIKSGMLTTLYEMRRSQNFRALVLEKASKNITFRRSLIEAIRQVYTIGERYKKLVQSKEDLVWLESNKLYNSGQRESQGIRKFLENLHTGFAPVLLDTMSERNKSSGFATAKIKYLAKIRSTMTSVAQTLEKKCGGM